MKPLVFYLSLVLCFFFIFSKTADAHPHTLGTINHGPSLETYNIQIDFSSNKTNSGEKRFNIKLADKNKDNKEISEKRLNKRTFIQTNNQSKKIKKENKK